MDQITKSNQPTSHNSPDYGIKIKIKKHLTIKIKSGKIQVSQKTKEYNMTERKQQIQQIVSTYVNKYTCASMADKQIYIDRECNQANQYLQEQINALNITKDELNAALDLINQTPCIFDSKMFK